MRWADVFVAQRIDMPSDAWQMPQGGIDEGETPESAAWREMQEETGTRAAILLAEGRALASLRPAGRFGAAAVEGPVSRAGAEVVRVPLHRHGCATSRIDSDHAEFSA